MASKKTKYIVNAALIAALYAGLTFLSNVFSLAYGPLQLRLSEALTILPLFTPAAIPGLTIGCFISNIASFNAIDMIFGTAATLAAAIITYLLRNIKSKLLPIIGIIPPILINALVIGLELAFLADSGFAAAFLATAPLIGLSELAVCLMFGVPLFYVIKKHKIFD